MNQNPKGHGYFRKSKAYGLVCGIALAGALMVSTQAKADELVEVTPDVVVTANPATNLPEAQPVTPEANVSLSGEAGTQTGELVSSVPSPELDQAVAKATEAGVAVTTGDKVTHDSLSSAQADLAKQETAVTEATAKQEANTTAINNAVEENKAIDKANADEKARVDALNKQGEADTKARNEAGQKAVDAENAKAKADADKAIADRDGVIASNTEKEEKYKAEQKAYESAQADYEKAEKAYQDALKAKNQAEATNTANNAEYVRKQAEYNEAKKAYDLAKAEYDQAVKAKEQAIAGNTASQAEYEAALAEYEKQKAVYDKKKADYDKAVATQGVSNAEYQRQLAEYETAKTNYDAEVERINRANAEKRAAYEAAMQRYEQEKAEATRNTTKEGYLKEVLAQGLIFENEPTANMTLTGDFRYFRSYNGRYGNAFEPHVMEYLEGNGSLVDSMSSPITIEISDNLPSYPVVLEPGQTVTATYTNLQNSSYGGVKISKVVYEITQPRHKETSSTVFVMTDPTNGVVNSDHDSSSLDSAQIVIKFFDEQGNQISFNEETPAIIGLSSLNNMNNNYSEKISNYSFDKVVLINGSMVGIHPDGVYAEQDTSYGNNPKGWVNDDWDQKDNPNFYFAAAAGVQSSGNTIRFTMSSGGGEQWLSISSKVATLGGITKRPTEPSYEKLPPAPIPPKPVEGDLPPLPEPPVKPTPPTGTVPNVPDAPKEPKAPTPPTPVDVPTVPTKPTPPTPVTPPSLDDVPLMPTKPEFVTPVVKTFKPEVYVPVNPKVTPHVPVPNKENHKASVHPVEIKQIPTNVKSVENSDMVSINGQLVPKNDLVTWTLTNTGLKAGRDEVKSYVLVDPLPAGFALDKDATDGANPAWVIATDEAGALNIFATPATLAALNEDRNSDVNVPVVKLIGRPVNDGGTYENTFKTVVTTPKGEYTTVSNTPKIYTPGDDSRTYNGQVIVRYRSEDGDLEIRKDVLDVEDGKVGSSYDTTDNRPDKIAFEGKLYERTSKVVGNETGEIVKGKTYVTYYYKLVPNTPEHGSVIVHYEDEEGRPIKNDVVDTPEAPVGSDYDTRDNKPKKIKTNDGVEYELVPNKTRGKEDGKITSGTTEVTYVYKRTTPKPPTPTPNDNLIQPKKDVVDENGVSINGKQVLPNTPINYVLTQDFDQYNGMVASKEAIAKGFIYIEDYLDEAVDANSFTIKSIVAKNGDSVKDLYEMRHVLSKDTLDGRLAELVKASGVSPVGAFYMAVVKDPESFFKNYVQKGLSVTYDVLFKLKEGFVGKVTNQTFQIDFGNGYYSNIVENEVPELKVNKDVVIDGKAVDKGEVKLGDMVDYVLEGWVIPADRGYDIKEYRFVDILQSSHDEYQGFKVIAKVDITLADGTVIKKGTELSEYVVQTYDVETGTFELKFNDEFLAQIPRSSAFGSDVLLKAKRIKSGTVENEFTLYVNGIPVKSDKVITETPEPPKPPTPEDPETPEVPEEPKKEVPPTPVTPPAPKQMPKQALPQTGDTGNVLGLVGTLLSGLGLVGLKRKKD